MNVLHILDLIQQEDPEIYERLDTRRAAMRQFANIGKKLAAAAVPVALGSMLNKAYGQVPAATLLGILNYALTLEYLEAEFYATALAAPGLIPAGPVRTGITTIAAHEAAHVKFLIGAITGAGATPVAKPKFDFSANGGSNTPGPLAAVFKDYPTFLVVAQALEDTGVRAYKGQAGFLVKGGDVLTAALNIHSVEARHASYIRQVRRAQGANIKPWITGDDPGAGAANPLISTNYKGEGATKQAGIELDNLQIQLITGPNETRPVLSPRAVSEAFDEPLTREEVLFIVGPFIVR